MTSHTAGKLLTSGLNAEPVIFDLEQKKTFKIILYTTETRIKYVFKQNPVKLGFYM